MAGASFRLVCSFPLVNPDLLKALQQALEVGQAPWQGLAGLQGLVLLPALGLSFTGSLYICKMSTSYSGAPLSFTSHSLARIKSVFRAPLFIHCDGLIQRLLWLVYEYNEKF